MFGSVAPRGERPFFVLVGERAVRTFGIGFEQKNYIFCFFSVGCKIFHKKRVHLQSELCIKINKINITISL